MLTFKVSKTDYINFKKKKKARLCVTRAIRKGDLIRSDKCELCKKECNTNAHHIDYGNPLSVLWVCSKCHGLCHREEHELNPKNNVQTVTPTVWQESDSITVSINIPIRQFMVLKEESKKSNKNISSLIRNDINQKYYIESSQLEFDFDKDINEKTQDVQDENLKISIIRNQGTTDMSRMEDELFQFPVRYGTNL